VDDEPCVQASAWVEADALFRGDAGWVGADGAFSVDLGNDRTLWLFSDTWVDPSGKGNREEAHMVRNTVAIQVGTDPSQATIKYYWQSTEDGVPKAFFARDDDTWFWPGHGIRLDDRLIIFLNRLGGTSAGLGFESIGWAAVMVDNPDDEPPEWRIRLLPTPSNSLGIAVGFASVLRIGEYLYAFGTADADKSHPVHVARWPVTEVHDGDLQAPDWWGGVDAGWIADSSSLSRAAIIENGQSELTIHFDTHDRQFVAVQTVDFGKSDIAIRRAGKLIGPWTAARRFFRPPEYDRPNVMIYSAKAHPQLTGADIVLTYSTNTFEFEEHWTDPDIYYPHFVRLQRCSAQNSRE
jgi:hypothetical protein